jgi:hypothetical protein
MDIAEICGHRHSRTSTRRTRKDGAQSGGWPLRRRRAPRAATAPSPCSTPVDFGQRWFCPVDPPLRRAAALLENKPTCACTRPGGSCSRAPAAHRACTAGRPSLRTRCLTFFYLVCTPGLFNRSMPHPSVRLFVCSPVRTRPSLSHISPGTYIHNTAPHNPSAPQPA